MPSVVVSDGLLLSNPQGSEDVCLLNFCVFLLWDYVPTVWLLLVMEGTTGEHVGTSVVKASRTPARAAHAVPHGGPLARLKRPDLPFFGSTTQTDVLCSVWTSCCSAGVLGVVVQHTHTQRLVCIHVRRPAYHTCRSSSAG